MKPYTSVPWQQGSEGFIVKVRPGTTNIIIAQYLSGNPEDAAFIVHAVNSHEILVEALKGATRVICELIPEDPAYPEFAQTKNELLQAIAQAEGK